MASSCLEEQINAKTMTYEESKYLADPDFLATVNIYDETLGRTAAVEVGYAYNSFGGRGRKLQGIKIVLCPGDYERQLLYEAATLDMVPFKRTRPDDSRKPGARPRQTYRPGPALSP